MTPGQHVVLSLTFQIAYRERRSRRRRSPWRTPMRRRPRRRSASRAARRSRTSDDEVALGPDARRGRDLRRLRRAQSRNAHGGSEEHAGEGQHRPCVRSATGGRARVGRCRENRALPTVSAPTAAVASRRLRRPGSAPEAKVPAATESVYVFAPQQAAVASRPAAPFAGLRRLRLPPPTPSPTAARRLTTRPRR